MRHGHQTAQTRAAKGPGEMFETWPGAQPPGLVHIFGRRVKLAKDFEAHLKAEGVDKRSPRASAACEKADDIFAVLISPDTSSSRMATWRSLG